MDPNIFYSKFFNVWWSHCTFLMKILKSIMSTIAEETFQGEFWKFLSKRKAQLKKSKEINDQIMVYFLYQSFCFIENILQDSECSQTFESGHATQVILKDVKGSFISPGFRTSEVLIPVLEKVTIYIFERGGIEMIDN